MDITWKIDNLEWNEETGLLVLAYWTVEGVDGEHSYSYSGTARFPEDPDAFGTISVADLDEEKAVAAVKANISDIRSIEAVVIRAVEDQKGASELVSGLPWEGQSVVNDTTEVPVENTEVPVETVEVPVETVE